MIINRTHKFMFFAEPHTASRACSRMLETIEGSESVGKHHMTHEEGIANGQLPARGYVRFAVIRDPREIIASQIARLAYVGKVIKDSPSKAELVERYVRFYCVRPKQFEHDYVDFKLRYEQLEPQLYDLLHRVGVKPIPALGRNPHESTKERKPWWHYFSKEQTERIYRDIPEVELFRDGI